jgi:hypothetical protein
MVFMMALSSPVPDPKDFMAGAAISVNSTAPSFGQLERFENHQRVSLVRWSARRAKRMGVRPKAQAAAEVARALRRVTDVFDMTALFVQ